MNLSRMLFHAILERTIKKGNSLWFYNFLINLFPLIKEEKVDMKERENKKLLPCSFFMTDELCRSVTGFMSPDHVVSPLKVVFIFNILFFPICRLVGMSPLQVRGSPGYRYGRLSL